eukprot:4553747-Prymnesium_polylepis.1
MRHLEPCPLLGAALDLAQEGAEGGLGLELLVEWQGSVVTALPRVPIREAPRLKILAARLLQAHAEEAAIHVRLLLESAE